MNTIFTLIKVRRYTSCLFLCSISVFSLKGFSETLTLHPSKAYYQATIKGFQLTIERHVENILGNQWLIRQNAGFSLGNLSEKSAFNLTPVVSTINHHYQRSLLGSAREYKASFSQKHGAYTADIHDSKKGEFQLTADTQLFSDLSYQVALRQALLHNHALKDISFNIAKNKSSIKRYSFQRVDEKLRETAIGKLDVVRFAYKKQEGASIEFWLAVKHDYLVVKVVSIEKGKTVYQLDVKSFELYRDASQAETK